VQYHSKKHQGNGNGVGVVETGRAQNDDLALVKIARDFNSNFLFRRIVLGDFQEARIKSTHCTCQLFRDILKGCQGDTHNIPPSLGHDDIFSKYPSIM